MTIENSLFYTFSAIPQTLAGAIGIMGAFVLYKFQCLDNEIQKKADEIIVRKGISRNDPTMVSVLRQAFLNCCIYGEEFAKKQPFNTAWFRGEEAPIKLKLMRKIDLRRQLVRSAMITAVVIVISLLVLMNVDFLKQKAWISGLTFTLGFIGSVVSVLSYVGILVYSLVDDEGAQSSISAVMKEAWCKLKAK